MTDRPKPKVVQIAVSSVGYSVNDTDGVGHGYEEHKLFALLDDGTILRYMEPEKVDDDPDDPYPGDLAHDRWYPIDPPMWGYNIQPRDAAQAARWKSWGVSVNSKA